MIDPIYAQLGAAIRDARNVKRITQGELADKIGLSRTSITNIEAGRQQILFHTLRDIADVLNINLFTLLQSIKPLVSVHGTHCCRHHGCKYGEENCPVVLGLEPQLYSCEVCTTAPADPLLQPCPDCDGKDSACPTCAGDGEVPTAEGAAILELFKRCYKPPQD